MIDQSPLSYKEPFRPDDITQEAKSRKMTIDDGNENVKEEVTIWFWMEGFFSETFEICEGLSECQYVPDPLGPMVYFKNCKSQSGVCPKANSSSSQLISQAELG